MEKLCENDEELMKHTSMFMEMIKNSKVKMKPGMTPEKIINLICVTPESERIKEFVNKATKPCMGEDITTIDLLYNYNVYTKTKLTMNIFAKEIKKEFEIKSKKYKERRLSVLVNRQWRQEYDNL